MRQISIAFILSAVMLTSGCTSFYQKSESLLTGRQVSAFMEKDVVPVNRKLINSLIAIINKDGYERDGFATNTEDDEYFDSVKVELRQEYDREYRVASIACESVYDQALNQYKLQALVGGVAFSGFMPHSKAGRAMDGCLLGRGWEAGTQRMYDEIVNLAWKRIAHDRKKTAAIAIAPSPAEANIAERVFENTWRSIVVIESGNNQGSGVVIRPNLVATNCHIIDGGNIVVYKTGDRRTLTDSRYNATINRKDTKRDFCLLNVDGLWGIPANIRSYDSLKVGEDVYALGAPKGLDLSLSAGIISRLRKIDGEQLIQTDTAISPGSSGGGLFDSESNLIGITTSGRSGENVEGINFAIPADLAL